MDQDQFQKAMRLLDAGEPQKALGQLVTLAQAEATPDEMVGILLGEVDCLIRLGRLEEARERWHEASSYSNSIYTECSEIHLCVAEGRPDEALRLLERFAARRDEFRQLGAEDVWSDAAERVGRLLFEQTRYSDAVRPLELALLHPGTAERRNELLLYEAICFIQNNDYAAADRAFRTLSLDKADPLWPTMQYHLGRLRYKLGSYRAAKVAFELSELSTRDEELRANIPLWLNRIENVLPPGRPE